MSFAANNLAAILLASRSVLRYDVPRHMLASGTSPAGCAEFLDALNYTSLPQPTLFRVWRTRRNAVTASSEQTRPWFVLRWDEACRHWLTSPHRQLCQGTEHWRTLHPEMLRRRDCPLRALSHGRVQRSRLIGASRSATAAFALEHTC